MANFVALAPDALTPLGGYPGDEEKAAQMFGQLDPAKRSADLLAAAVPFYGGQPQTADVPNIKAPLMLHYAGLDERVNAGWPAFEAALKANGKKYQEFVYPNTNHGFHNDTTPRYDEGAAKLAWSRTLDFFNANLRGA